MEAQKPHVVYFPAWYPHRNDPMPGLFVKHHAESALPYAAISVLQIVGEERRTGDQLEFEFVEEDGIPTQRVYYKKTPGKLGKLFDAYLYVLATNAGYSRLIAKTRKADLHHVHILTRAGLFPWLIRISGGVPYLITEHWSRYLARNRQTNYTGFLRKWLTKRIVSKAAAVCPVNEKLAEAMQEVGLKNSNYELINNVVDLSRFDLPKQEPSANKFLHVSCFDEKPKNVKGLLDALMIAVKKNPGIFLTLVGDGPDWELAREHARKIGADPYTDFVGLKQGDALVQAFKDHAHFVLFSRYENQPVVILEALACGMNVISSKVGSVPKVLENERGVLVEVEDEQGLAELMIKAAREYAGPRPELREYVSKNFSFEAVGKQHARLYARALGHESE